MKGVLFAYGCMAFGFGLIAAVCLGVAIFAAVQTPMNMTAAAAGVIGAIGAAIFADLAEKCWADRNRAARGG